MGDFSPDLDLGGTDFSSDLDLNQTDFSPDLGTENSLAGEIGTFQVGTPPKKKRTVAGTFSGYVETTWPTNTVAPQRTLFPGDVGEACVEWGSESRFGYPPEQATNPSNYQAGFGVNLQKGKNKKEEPEDDDKPVNASHYKEKYRLSRHVIIEQAGNADNYISVERILVIIFEHQRTGKTVMFELDQQKQLAGTTEA